MQFPESKGVRAGQWFPNEIFRDDDINFLNEKEYTNITATLVAIAEQGIFSGADVVIAGLLLEWDNLLTSNLRAGMAVSPSGYYFQSGSWGFGASAGDVFSVTVPVSTSIAVLAGGSQPRIDVLEVRPTRTEYDSKSRNYKDPVTGLVTAAPTHTKIEYGFGFQILQGTESASPSAPTRTAGWIKLAEIYVAASATAIDQDDIKDVRDSDTWTTEADDTVYKTITQADKVPISDAGSRYTAIKTEGALQEIAGSGRTTETVKQNADNIGVSIKRTGQTIDSGVSVKDCVYYDSGDSKWKLSGKWRVPPQGIYIGSNTVLLFGYISGLTGLVAGKVYWITKGGLLTTDIDISYKATRVAYALSTTELIFQVWLEKDFNSKAFTWGFFGGGTSSNVIDYIDLILTTGNAADRGDLTGTTRYLAGVSGIEYGFYAGGIISVAINVIEYISLFLNSGNAADRGDLPTTEEGVAGVSGHIYGFIGGGGASGGPYANEISYLDLNLITGNATDGGDLTLARRTPAGVEGETYGFFGGGWVGSASNVIDYITLSSAIGNAADKGDLIISRYLMAGVSGSTYGFFCGGSDGAPTNVIEYIDLTTISGNAADRGDLTLARSGVGGVNEKIYGFIGGGNPGPSNIIDYIDLTLITGGAADKGDLTIARNGLAGVN